MKMSVILKFFFLCFSFLPAADFTNITGSGSGTTENQALLKAKQDAIEKSVGLLISAKSIVENYTTISDLVIARANGFVKKYQVVRKETKDGLTEVEISAEVTGVVDEIIKDKAALQLLITEMGLPAFAVVITGADGKRDSNSENILINQLLGKGFKIKNTAISASDDFKQLSENGIDYVLRGSLTAESVNMSNIYNIQSMKSIQTTLECRLIDTRSSEIISAKTVAGKGAHIAENTAKVKSLENCIPALTAYILSNAVDRWTREVSTVMQDISVEITDISGTASTGLIKKLDSCFQGGEKLFDKGFADQRQKTIVRTSLSVEQLFELFNRLEGYQNRFVLIEKGKNSLLAGFR